MSSSDVLTKTHTDRHTCVSCDVLPEVLCRLWCGELFRTRKARNITRFFPYTTTVLFCRTLLLLLLILQVFAPINAPSTSPLSPTLEMIVFRLSAKGVCLLAVVGLLLLGLPLLDGVRISRFVFSSFAPPLDYVLVRLSNLFLSWFLLS